MRIPGFRTALTPLALLTLLAVVAVVAAPATGQEPRQERPPDRHHQHHPQGERVQPQEGAELPPGWRLRLDRAGNAADVIVREMDGGWHIRTGPSVILWAPEWRAGGCYRVEATITQTEPSEHPEAYGIFVGGRALEGAHQEYLYFLIRQDGRYLIRRRAGAEVPIVKPWTEHEAVQRPSATGGAATNTLAVDVGAETVDFYVNGERVERVPREGLPVDGIVGLRINHRLDTHVAALRIDPRGGDPR
jgi:hypothetical protein